MPGCFVNFRRGAVPVAGLVAGLMIGLAGCAKPSPDARMDASGADGERLWALHRAQVGAVLAWRIEGKMSIRRDDRLWGAAMNWLHDEDSDSMNFLGPGGRTLARLNARPGGARAVDNKGRTYRAATFEALAVKVLRLDVPVASLRYWIAGVPDPGLDIRSVHLDRDGRAEELEQGGWRVRYLGYAPVESLSLQTLELPSLLVLTRANLEVTVAVDQWRLLKFSGAARRAT